MPTKPLLTARLTAALAASGLSQSDLARRVGVTRGAVNSWSTGRAVALRWRDIGGEELAVCSEEGARTKVRW